MFKFIRKIDIFYTDLPGFTFQGNSKGTSTVGGCATLFITLLSIQYGLIKLQGLLERLNPSVISVIRPNEIDSDQKYSTIENNFAVAFGIENYFSNESLDDSKYIKWVASYVRYENGESMGRTELLTYQCTDEDFSQFYPVDPGSEARLAALRAGVKTKLYCIDWASSNFDIYGREDILTYGHIDIAAVPCSMNLKYDFPAGPIDIIDPECVRDLDAAKKYIRPPNLLLYMNQQSFNQENYDDESIEKYSTFVTRQFDENVPTFFPIDIQKN